MSLTLFLITLFSIFSPLTFAIQCNHCFRSGNYNQCFNDCSGHFCTLHAQDGVVIQGCLTGVPDISSGCRPTPQGFVCLCQSNHCNSELAQPPVLPRPPSIRCLTTKERIRFNWGNDLEKKECIGNACFARSETYLEAPGQAVHVDSSSCHPPLLRPAFHEILGFIGEAYQENSCYQVKDDPSNQLLDCSCNSGDFCNENITRSVDQNKRESIYHECYMSPQERTDSNHSNSTCLGRFCFIQRATINSGDDFKIVTYRKGCFNVTGSKKYISVGYRKFDHGTTTEESWFCDKKLCNKNMAVAKLAVEFIENTDINLGSSNKLPTEISRQTETTTSEVLGTVLIETIVEVVDASTTTEPTNTIISNEIYSESAQNGKMAKYLSNTSPTEYSVEKTTKKRKTLWEIFNKAPPTLSPNFKITVIIGLFVLLVIDFN